MDDFIGQGGTLAYPRGRVATQAGPVIGAEGFTGKPCVPRRLTGPAGR